MQGKKLKELSKDEYIAVLQHNIKVLKNKDNYIVEKVGTFKDSFVYQYKVLLLGKIFDTII